MGKSKKRVKNFFIYKGTLYNNKKNIKVFIKSPLQRPLFCSQSSGRNGKIGLCFSLHRWSVLYVYDADLFGTFKQELITYYRTGGSNEAVLHFMIPIEQLHRIEI